MTTRRQQNRWVLWILVMAIAICPMTLSAETFVAHELVLEMEPGNSVDIVLATYPGTQVVQNLPQLDLYLLNYTVSANLDSISNEIETLSAVKFCHPNYRIDPLQPVQSSLPISDEVGGQNYYDQEAATQLQLTSAHNYSTGNAIKVGVLDGGVNAMHPDLLGYVTSGWDYVDDDADAHDETGGDNSGHGTFVAGVIHLVAPEAEILSYRVTDIHGESNGYIVAEAILQAVDDGCTVINLSMVTMEVHEAIGSALEYAWNNGVLTVAAAGNGQTSTAHYPASDMNTLAVAAVDPALTLADFSSFGGHVDLCAPGTEIYAPYQDIYAWWGGTSFAAPFVSAQAALLMSVFTIADVSEIKDVILNSAVDIDEYNEGYEGQLGAGILDVMGSLSSEVCGNLNASTDGKTTLADVTLLIDHLYISGAALPAPENADVDDWEGITGNDVQRLIDHIYVSNAPLDCEPDNSGLFPLSTADILQAREIEIPPGNNSWTVEFWLSANGEFEGFSLPFKLSFDNPSISVAEIRKNDAVPNAMVNIVGYDPATSSGVIGLHSFGINQIPAGWHLIGSVDLVNTYSEVTQVIAVDTGTYRDNGVMVLSRGGGMASVTPATLGLAGDLDSDNDGISDAEDNCPFDANPGQEDADGDGNGDACDLCPGDDFADYDSDGIPNDCDNCPTVANYDQSDIDGDGAGDACDECPGSADDTDTDLDGHPDGCDNCPTIANADQEDIDNDGIGRACDDCVDLDNDGYGTEGYADQTCPIDNCGSDYNPDQADGDGDGFGDECDACPDLYTQENTDYDHDGVGDECDNCPGAHNPDQWDTDGDGLGDACDGENYMCGNVNGDEYGDVNLADVTMLIDHLAISQMPLPYPERGDVDDWWGLTTNDLAILFDHLYVSMDPLDCTPTQTPPFPVSETDSIHFQGLTIPAGNNDWHVEVYMTSSYDWQALSMPITVSSSNPAVTWDSLVIPDDLGGLSMPTPLNRETGEGMIFLLGLPPDFSGGYHHIATLVLKNTYSETDHTVLIDTLPVYPPSNTTVLSHDGGRTPVRPIIVGLASDTDSDDDGIPNAEDNCPFAANAGQSDSDSDGRGDACDNCPEIANADQSDIDADGIGDTCDICPADVLNDADLDGICGGMDNCPSISNGNQADADNDGIGDACDQCPGGDDYADADGDTVPDDCDNCRTMANASQSDADSDGIGDECDLCPNGDESCGSVCTMAGDVNFDGQLNHDDLTSLIDYVYLAGAPPQNPVDADCDNHVGITTRDIIYLQSAITGGAATLTCPPTHLDLPAIDTTTILRHPTVLAPYSVQFQIPLTLESTVPVQAFNFPLEIRINGTIIPDIDSFVVDENLISITEESWEFYPAIVFRTEPETATALVSGVGFIDATPLPAGINRIGTLHLTIQPSSAEREINITWGTIKPVQPLPVEYPNDGLYPVVMYQNSLPEGAAGYVSSLQAAKYGVYLEELGPVLSGGDCCIGYRDNPNGDELEGSLADITYLIAYTYLHGPDPVCFDEGNTNGSPDNKITLSDITRLIDKVYISKNPTAPCGEYQTIYPAKASADVERTAKADFDGSATVIELESSTDITGVELILRGNETGTPELLLPEEMNMIVGTDNDLTTIALVDLEGMLKLEAGTHALVRLPGQFELLEATISDENHRDQVVQLAQGGDDNLPDSYELSQNYPNPFNPRTNITFAIPVATEVSLQVYNVLGKEVAEVAGGFFEAGVHEVVWEGTNSTGDQVASGVYFYRLTTSQFTQTRKMLLLK